MESRAGTFVDISSDWTILDSDSHSDAVRIFKENGSLLCHWIPHAISDPLCQLAVQCYHKVGQQVSTNRGHAAGLSHRILTNSYERGNLANTGIIGYFDKANSQRPCRLTEFSRKHLELYQEGFPFLREMDRLLQQCVPDHHERQRSAVQQATTDTGERFQIEDTAFSTVTVNLNFRTAIHKDSGDYKDGFGALAIVSQNITGGWLCFPQYHVAIPLGRGDFIAMDVHEWHGNTPITQLSSDAYRIAFVAYFRERLLHCKDIHRRLALTDDTSTEKLLRDIFGNADVPRRPLSEKPKDWVMENETYRIEYKGKRYRFYDKINCIKILNLWPAWEYVIRRQNETS